MRTVLVRWGEHSASLTGWGWVALFMVLGAIEEIGRRR